jgi:DNA-binding transcriptional LysR family regulator
MQIELIDTFLDLLDTRSFNRTAENLGVTQSTVSARVVALERAVGRKLLNRSRAGTELTTAGMWFAPHARSLRHGWTFALRDTNSPGDALSLRVGLQLDLAESHIGDWVAEFREALPETNFYLEPDYSIQMNKELLTGRLDFAVLYTPRFGPDLHFESVGELNYILVSTGSDQIVDLSPTEHIRASYSPSFDMQLTRLHPEFADTPVASGQNAAVTGLLSALGGSAYVIEETAEALHQQGTARPVRDAAPIAQTVYAGMHVRRRHSRAHTRLITIVRRHLTK